MEISVNGKTLKLQPHQVEHFERIKNILLKNHCYIDLSETGLGKTYIVMAIAMTFGFRLLVICPVIMISVWKKIAEEYGVSFIKINTERKDDAEDGILSYESLRSTKNHQPKHGLLSRSEDANGVSNFSATEKFTQIAKEGIFVVFDEVQKIKNSSDQYKACKTIAETCLEVGNQTRFALLSAMPVDKEIQIINILRVAGYIRHAKLYMFYKDAAKLSLLGAQELINTCKFLDPDRTAMVMKSFPLDSKNVASLCFRLYVHVIQPKITSAMPPLSIGVEKDVKNGYYNMSKEAAESLSRHISGLASASHYDVDSNTYDSKKADWGAITIFHMACESDKLEIFERLARKSLSSDNDTKIILVLTYIKNIHALEERLSSYQPMIMYGNTSPKDRVKIVDSFQNDPTRRLLIANIRVVALGISLDDKIGDKPRITYISPTYSIQDIHQATGRTYRWGTKSKATIRMVYGKCGNQEMSILNALSRKTDVARQTLELQVQSGIRFPGEYPDEIED